MSYLTIPPISPAGSGFTSTTTAGTAIVGTNNSAGLSLGVPAYLTTAMVSNAGSNFVAATAGFNGTNASGTIASNSISVSVANPGISNINVSAGTTSNNLSALTFANSNNVSFGINASTITASVPAPLTVSSLQLGLVQSGGNSALFGASAGSTSYCQYLYIPNYLSASFIRMPVLMTTNSTTLGTTNASANASGAIYSTWNAALYSLGVGASSRSLTMVCSGQALFTQQNSISVTGGGTQHSYTQNFTWQVEGNQSNTQFLYSLSTDSYQFFTTNFHTNFTSARALDIPLATLLTPGPYWIIMGGSSSSATNSAGFGAITACNVRMSAHYVATLVAGLAVGAMGDANRSLAGPFSLGSFSTAGGGTTSNLPLSAITGGNIAYGVAFLRSA